MVFYRILEFSDGALVLRVYDGSPRVRNFLHDSPNHLSVGIGIYERGWFHFANNIITRALALMSRLPIPSLVCSKFLLLQPKVVHPIFRDCLFQSGPARFEPIPLRIWNRIVPGFGGTGESSRDYLSELFSYIWRIISKAVDFVNPSG